MAPDRLRAALHTAFHGPLRFEGSSGQSLVWPNGSSRGYDGQLGALLTNTAALHTINTLSWESYLHGVVPRESPSSFHPDALRAQAVAARPYSLYKLRHSGTQGYDICSTTVCQVYTGHYLVGGSSRTSIQPASTTAAVDATAGMVRTYGGADENHVIFAEFDTSNGGWSAASAGKPYLRGRRPSRATPASRARRRSTRVRSHSSGCRCTACTLMRASRRNGSAW